MQKHVPLFYFSPIDIKVICVFFWNQALLLFFTLQCLNNDITPPPNRYNSKQINIIYRYGFVWVKIKFYSQYTFKQMDCMIKSMDI